MRRIHTREACRRRRRRCVCTRHTPPYSEEKRRDHEQNHQAREANSNPLENELLTSLMVARAEGHRQPQHRSADLLQDFCTYLQPFCSLNICTPDPERGYR